MTTIYLFFFLIVKTAGRKI